MFITLSQVVRSDTSRDADNNVVGVGNITQTAVLVVNVEAVDSVCALPGGGASVLAVRGRAGTLIVETPEQVKFLIESPVVSEAFGLERRSFPRKKVRKEAK